MAVTGTLNADFAAFYTATQKATASLAGMEGGAAKVEAAVENIGTGSAAPLNTLKGSFSQVDQVLASSGVNIGKYARGLDEIAAMAGKTVLEVGLLGSAASIAGAAIAGWQFGTWIAGVTGLDKAILGLVDSYSGLAAASAGAAGDTLVLATQRAGRAIYDLNEALAINIQWQKEHAAQLELQNAQYMVSAERFMAAQKEVRGLTEAKKAEIVASKEMGASDAQLVAGYTITADALRVLLAQKKLAAAQADLHAAAIKREEAASKAYDVEIANQIVLFDNLNKAAKAATDLKTSNNAAAGWIAQQVAIKKGIDDEAAATRAYLTEQEALTAATDALSQAHTTAGTAAVSATAGAVAGYAGVAQQVQISGDAVKEWINLMKYAAAANAINRTNSLFQTTSQAEALANIGSSFGNRGGGAPSVVNNFSIVDTEANIAQRVSKHVTDSVLRMGPV